MPYTKRPYSKGLHPCIRQTKEAKGGEGWRYCGHCKEPLEVSWKKYRKSLTKISVELPYNGRLSAGSVQRLSLIQYCGSGWLGAFDRLALASCIRNVSGRLLEQHYTYAVHSQQPAYFMA